MKPFQIFLINILILLTRQVIVLDDVTNSFTLKLDHQSCFFIPGKKKKWVN